MKKLILILLATVTVPAALLAQDSRDIQTTPFTRKFLHSTNAIDAAQQLGGVGTNGITSLQGTNIVVAIIATNNFVHKDITNGLATTNFVNSVTANMVTNTYNLKAFGAYGDATFVNGVLASSNTPIVTVTLGKFTAGDMGKIIGIFGGGKNRTTFWTGISNVTSSTSIVLSNAVFMSYNATNIDFPDNNVANFSQAGANGYMAVYGAHDDSGAIQSWVNQVTNSATKVNNFYAPAGNYLILNPPQLTNQNNAQIIIPVPGEFNSAGDDLRGNAPVMNLFGDYGSVIWGINPGGQFKPSGTVFISNLQGLNNAPSQTNLIGASVFDFRAYNPGNASAIIYVNTPANGTHCYWPNNVIHPHWHDFKLLMGYDCNAVGLNFIGANETELEHILVDGGGFIADNFCPQPEGTNGFGIIMPGNFNGSYSPVHYISVVGFLSGIDMGIIQGDYITLEACSNGFTAAFSGSANLQTMEQVQMTATPNWINMDGGFGRSANRLFPQIKFSNWQNVTLGGNNPAWQSPMVSVRDSLGLLSQGWIYYSRQNGIGIQPSEVQPPAVSFGGHKLLHVLIDDGDLGADITNIDDRPKIWGGTQNFTNLVTMVAQAIIKSGLTVTNGSLFCNGGAGNIFDGFNSGYVQLVIRSTGGNISQFTFGGNNQEGEWNMGINKGGFLGGDIATTYDWFIQSVNKNLLNFHYNIWGTTNGVTHFYSGIASWNTNWIPSAGSGGYTNTSGWNQIINIKGVSGTYIYYNRSDEVGQTVSAVPVFTNSVTTSGTLVPLPVNCGVQVVSGSGVTTQVIAN